MRVPVRAAAAYPAPTADPAPRARCGAVRRARHARSHADPFFLGADYASRSTLLTSQAVIHSVISHQFNYIEFNIVEFIV